MTTDASRQLVRGLFDHHLNATPLDRLDEVFAPTFVSDIAGARDQRGPIVFATPILRLRAAFPDLRYRIHDLVAEGERVAVRWSWEGTFTAPYVGAVGTIAPNGAKIESAGFGVFEIADGKVARASIETDRLGFLVAIGAIQAPPGLAPPPRAT